jgi:hypothetical protein
LKRRLIASTVRLEAQMTVTEAERQKILDDERERQRRELSERMRKLGKVRSPKKRAAVINNLKAAHEARFGRPYGYKPKGKKK